MSEHAADCAIYSARVRLCDCGRGLQMMRDGGESAEGNEHAGRLAQLAARDEALKVAREALHDARAVVGACACARSGKVCGLCREADDRIRSALARIDAAMKGET